MESDGAGSLVETVMSAFGEPAGVEDEDVAKLPLVYGLSQNYPNPFNPATTITVDIPGEEANGSDEAKVLTNLSIFDVRGRLVRILVDKELSPGRYRVTWDGKDANGREVSSGIYFYRVNAGNFSSTRKMTLMK